MVLGLLLLVFVLLLLVLTPVILFMHSLMPSLILLLPISMFMFILMLLVLPTTISSRSERFRLLRRTLAFALTSIVVLIVSKLQLLFLSPIDDVVKGNLAKASSSCSASSCFAPDDGSGGGGGGNGQLP